MNSESVETQLSILDRVRIGVGMGSAALFGIVTLAATNPEVSAREIASGLSIAGIGILQALPATHRLNVQRNELESVTHTDSQQI